MSLGFIMALTFSLVLDARVEDPVRLLFCLEMELLRMKLVKVSLSLRFLYFKDYIFRLRRQPDRWHGGR